MRKTMYILVPIFLIIIMMVIIMQSNPLRKSGERIREDMLKLTPIGASMEDVISVMENNKKWKIRYAFDKGYSMLGGYPSGPYYDNDDTIVGVKSLDVCIGEYGAIFATGVLVFYGFGEDSQLIDIAVKKGVNTL